MKRLLIFTVLFPPLALIVFIATEWRHGSLPIGLLFFMLGYAYPIAVIPAWLTAGVDGVLSAQPFYLRLVATMVAAAVLAELTARYLGQDIRGELLTIGLMGAIPAAMCSWLSSEKQNGKAQ
jgi:hypothetical protein